MLPGEGEALLGFWGNLSANAGCGMVVIVPDGIAFESLDEYAERYHQRKLGEQIDALRQQAGIPLPAGIVQ
jgi:hypothetical protein